MRVRAIQCRAMHKLPVLLLLVILVLASVVPRSAHADDDVGWLLAQINGLRAAHGIGPLTLNPQLMASATGHSQYLSTNPWRDPHVEANGSTPHSRIAAAGYAGGKTGENVYGGGMATASIAFNWWVASPPHFQGMVNADFTEVGIGIASGPYGKYFTTDFGGGGGAVPPQPAAPAAPPNQSPNQSPNVAADVPTQPKPTRRPASPVPTVTPSITLTPSLTFTALPSRTPAPTTTAEPPTPTPIVIEVSPQPGAVMNKVADLATLTPTPISSPMVALPSLTLTPVSTQPAAISAAISAATAPGSDTIRTLIPFALGLQVLILGGVLLRRNRR